MGRYARQEILPEVGTAGQAKLARAQVMVVGAGGLGCPVLQYLVGAGVGQIILVDPDIVEESNLHRQPLYRMSDLGRPKVAAARDALYAANPAVRITALNVSLHPDNAPELVGKVELVIDAADSFAVSYTLSDACQARETPLISASVLGQSGYVGGFCGSAPSLRSVFPELPDDGATCAIAGVLGPAVGVVGSMQAQFALRVLLDSNPSPLGQMVTIDLANLRFGGFNFLGCPEPDEGLRFLAKCMLRDSDRIIELRSEDEMEHPIVPTAVRMTHEELYKLPASFDQRVVLCCGTGLRAWRVASLLRAAGHNDLALLAAKACE
ncbi:ThiF family adenylyltransferase [Aliiroseovarius sp. KMU-50]|uniref:ThiF family adenylyltransferase n=1 Tax=Aliiroseovarius salicola TaxID=3009082 RepID=A0ABT4VZI5_9RHOB|nr:ThiF family adenylyltransferase [Aliiroseovarius sp. KMU-50]MDA5093675.1 ThiF family adenylyltransferase [Aliiroseovarius sp. KMU-50]